MDKAESLEDIKVLPEIVYEEIYKAEISDIETFALKNLEQYLNTLKIRVQHKKEKLGLKISGAGSLIDRLSKLQGKRQVVCIQVTCKNLRYFLYFDDLFSVFYGFYAIPRNWDEAS